VIIPGQTSETVVEADFKGSVGHSLMLLADLRSFDLEDSRSYSSSATDITESLASICSKTRVPCLASVNTTDPAKFMDASTLGPRSILCESLIGLKSSYKLILLLSSLRCLI
jgi:hypothetical protein